MSSDLSVVLTEIQGVRGDVKGLRKEVREDQGKIWDEIKDLRTSDGNLRVKNTKNVGRLIALEKEQERMGDHMKDPKRHYNAHYSETLPQKLWRKKPEIAAGGACGTFLVALLFKLLEVLEWI